MATKIELAIQLIRNSSRIVAFTGAGISTEAGIPDFRSEGGVWENQELMELMSAPGFRRDPVAFYKSSMQLMPNIHRAQPTDAHKMLSLLEARGQLTAVITQNIDGLHQAAGSKTVYEIHGSFRSGHCAGCQAAYVMAKFYEQLERGEIDCPRCHKCQSPIKSDTILFGDMLPRVVWTRSVDAVGACDLMLVLGSSLVVYPAAELPVTAVSCGANLIIVNRSETELDYLANIAINCGLGDFSREVMKNL
ncbi:MAG: SIR2 family NAD-dependent protein deacylase [Blastocatellia bacterium]